MIKIENLYFSYPDSKFQLFIDSLSVDKGVILSIAGPNASGKTTLLNIISMLEKPKSGIIKILGHDVIRDKSNMLALRRNISFVFSQPYLLNDTVENNIFVPQRLRGVKDRKAVDEVIELLDISHLRNTNALILSQGEKHKVSIARTLVSKPKIILLDEPFLSIDEPTKESIIVTLRKIIKSNNSSAVFVTQNQDEVLAFSDATAVMKNGRILRHTMTEDMFTMSGPAGDLYDIIQKSPQSCIV